MTRMREFHRYSRQALATLLAIAVLLPAATSQVQGTAGRAMVAPGSCRGQVAEYVMVLQHYAGRNYSAGPSPASMIRFRDTERNDPGQHETLAKLSETGTLLGAAFDNRRSTIYAASYLKYDGLTSPAGPDAIYSYDLGSGTLAHVGTLPAGGHKPLGDHRNMKLIGKAGLGDIDIDPESDTLLVVNLLDRQIYQLSLPDGAVITSFPIGSAAEPWAADGRPLGLAIREGWVYHGVVDSRESAPKAEIPHGYIYRSRPDGTEMAQVAQFSFDYPRRAVPWRKWERVPPDASLYAPPVGQPMIADIEFATDGAMVIGLRDRAMDMHNGEFYYDHSPQGDVLHGDREGDHWSVQTGLSDWYQDDTQFYRDASQGMLAAVPEADAVIATALGVASSPHRPGSSDHLASGAIWLDNQSRALLAHESTVNCPKCQGPMDQLGDVEAVCPAAVPPTDTPSPSPTPPPSPTATASSTATPSTTPTRLPNTPTPTSTATRLPVPIYLPLLLREACTPEQRRVDVVLVLDASLSMLEPAAPGGGQVKLEAARDAALSFLDALHLDKGDQAAVVAFNEKAVLLTGLTANRTALNSALASITSAAQTCIVCGMDAGAIELTALRRKAANAPVLILLTDGRSQPQPVSDAVERAAKAKGSGIRIYTIGLGADLDEAALMEMASGPDTYFHAPSAEELAAIYRQIAVDIPCPAGAFWGRR